MRLPLRAGRALLCAAVASIAAPACYTAGGGTAPPTSSFYFPTGLAVSAGGNVLYAINSDFDLQWSGGTIQSYDLFKIRRDTAALIDTNLHGGDSAPPDIPFVYAWQPGCPNNPPVGKPDGSGARIPLGQACAPPVDSSQYVRDWAIVGAFATDLQMAANNGVPYGGAGMPSRIFAPLRGSAAVGWADVAWDDPQGAPSESDGASSFVPFAINCGKDSQGRCSSQYVTGNDPNQPGNTRNVTMPGEPFGMAQSQDGTALVVTSQTDTKSSLLTSGLNSAVFSGGPTMQFVLDGLPVGGNGIAAVPHDPDAVTRCEDVNDQAPCTRQAFLQTSRANAELDLLRYYDDDGSGLHRPFLQKEVAYPLVANYGGSDSRGIVIDDTPRRACKDRAGSDPAQRAACARSNPARVFFANRTPPSLIVGQIGATDPNGNYNPDALQITKNVPLSTGPSRVYLAPVVVPGAEAGVGYYAMRVFIVCFDSNAIFVYDPDAEEVVGTIYTGPGPYAMAFDPFSLDDVAARKRVESDPRQGTPIGRYRFAYVASFTQSYVQVVDLDSVASPYTFGQVVFTLGNPTLPKGR
jgi:hypothetical protein